MTRSTMLALLLLAAAPLSQAQSPALPDAGASDAQKLGWMQGFPPAADKTVRFDNGSFYSFPRLRWSFNHYREIVPTKTVSRGDGKVQAFASAPRDLDGVQFTTMDGRAMNFAEALQNTYADGVVVLHRGRIVYEKYFSEGRAERPHLAMSVTKSFVGTLAATLAVQGKLDPAAPITQYIPELKDSAYGDATVRQLMDMTVGVQYSENYADPKAEVFDYARAGGMLPAAPTYAGPRSFYDFLVTLKKEGEHGQAFAYKTANAEVLAWVVKRASGKSLADLMSEQIWSKLGVEQDAYFQIDRIGSESGGGGLNTTLRDLARFGEMMRNDGRANGQQVIPAAVVQDIRKGGDPAHFAKAGMSTLAGFSYRNMWWVSGNAHGMFMARGIHGQTIYIDPKAEVVIVRYASHPIAGNAANDPVTLPAFAAVANSLMK